MERDTIRIGTRDSQLALWQAAQVLDAFVAQGIAAELVPIKSEGDLDLSTPLYELGVQGIFTRTLDAALIAGRIDVAVHSMKDVPTRLARGLAEAAVLPRGPHQDILVPRKGIEFLDDASGVATIATSSTRRRAQWLHRYPNHGVENLRGNVNTRLKKLADSDWKGAMFAAAGLERIGLRPQNAIDLDWILPAPAQGAILVCCREEDAGTMEICKALHHHETAICVRSEREFLRRLGGGCSTPIGALATIHDGTVRLQGNLFRPDGMAVIDVIVEAQFDETDTLGPKAAESILAQGGQTILDAIH